MIRPVLILALLAALSSCNVAPEEVATFTPAPLYVDVTTGHGPMACDGVTPGFGYHDLFDGADYTGTCVRYRGDFAGDSAYSHAGYIVHPAITVRSMRVGSAGLTSSIVCQHDATGPAYAPCGTTQANPHFSAISDQPTMPWAPVAIVIGTYAQCPPTPGMTVLHMCSGTSTPEDGSLRATMVIGDGVVSPGLPYGHPLNLPNANSNAVDCIADAANYGLQAQFIRPPGYVYGAYATVGVAVYTCP